MAELSDEALMIRSEALDAALAVISSLPGDQTPLVSFIKEAKEMLHTFRDVSGAHAAFRDVRFALNMAGADNPILVKQLRAARNFY